MNIKYSVLSFFLACASYDVMGCPRETTVQKSQSQEISDLKNQLKMKSKEVSRINDEKIDFCDGLIKEKTNNLLLQSKVNRTERENKEKDKLIEKANKNLHELKKKNAEQANPGDINVEVGETTQIITAFNPTLKDATIGKDMKNSIAIINKIIKISETSKKKAKAEHECEHEKLMREASSIRLSFYKLDESNNTGGYQGTHNNIVELQDKVKDFSSSITVMSYLSSSQLKDLNKNSTNLQVICENMKSELERAKNTITESAVQIQQESDKSDVRNIITDREKKKSNPCCCTLF